MFLAESVSDLRKGEGAVRLRMVGLFQRADVPFRRVLAAADNRDPNRAANDIRVFDVLEAHKNTPGSGFDFHTETIQITRYGYAREVTSLVWASFEDPGFPNAPNAFSLSGNPRSPARRVLAEPGSIDANTRRKTRKILTETIDGQVCSFVLGWQYYVIRPTRGDDGAFLPIGDGKRQSRTGSPEGFRYFKEDPQGDYAIQPGYSVVWRLVAIHADPPETP